MNGIGGKLKDENKQRNYRKLFLFVVKSYVCFQTSNVHKSINEESMIEKLQKVTREKES